MTHKELKSLVQSGQTLMVSVQFPDNVWQEIVTERIDGGWLVFRKPGHGRKERVPLEDLLDISPLSNIDLYDPETEEDVTAVRGAD